MTLAPDFETSRTDDVAAPFPFAALRRIAAVLGAGFGALAVFVAVMSAPTAAERSVDRVLQASRGSATFVLGRAVSFAGSGLVVAAASVLLAAVVWSFTRRWRLAVVCLAGPALAGVGEIVMKQLVGRSRPITGMLTGESGYGFPSGHTAGAAALAAVAVITATVLISGTRMRRFVVGAAFLYAFMIGISRVVVGAHYGLDVVGGWLFGPAVALIASFLIIGVLQDPAGVAVPVRRRPRRDPSLPHP